jgi:hypothetical protein
MKTIELILRLEPVLGALVMKMQYRQGIDKHGILDTSISPTNSITDIISGRTVNETPFPVCLTRLRKRIPQTKIPYIDKYPLEHKTFPSGLKNTTSLPQH